VGVRLSAFFVLLNGESRAVLIDVQSYQEMKNAFIFLKVIRLSETE